MTKIDIISGFLGAGKTTFIKKMLKEAFQGEKVVLIENEFGEIGIDGGFLKEAGVEITEMNSGCICCSLVGDFGQALKKVMEDHSPERIIIEPSGVGKLSDVIKAVENVQDEHMVLNSFTTVADVNKCKMYMKNFGEFYNNQIENASTIILSRTGQVKEEKLEKAVALLQEKNPKAAIVTTPWEKLDGKQLLSIMEKKDTLEQELLEEVKDHHGHGDDECCGGKHHENGGSCCGKHHHEHEHHEHHHEHGEGCGCGGHHEHEHHHEHGEGCGCGGHHEHEHHHEHGEGCGCGGHHEHEHHHEHGEGCGCGGHHEHEHHHEHGEGCGCGGHHEHGHHHAEDVFTSWGKETPKKFTKELLEQALSALSETDDYGAILRAKGMVEGENGNWYYFDLVPEEYEIREGQPEYTGRICVIGANLKEKELEQLFQL